MKRTIFALYKGDAFIDVGTARDLAKKLNVSEETIKHYAAPCYHRKTKYNSTIRGYRLKDEE